MSCEDIIFFREQGRIGIVGDFNCRIGEEESRIVSEERGQQRKFIGGEVRIKR